MCFDSDSLPISIFFRAFYIYLSTDASKNITRYISDFFSYPTNREEKNIIMKIKKKKKLQDTFLGKYLNVNISVKYQS